MRIEAAKRTFGGICLMLTLAFALTGPLRGVTVEVEEDDDQAVSAPAPPASKPAPAKPAPAAKTQPSQTAPPAPHEISVKAEAPENASLLPRVRISDQIGFSYFVKSGYVTPEESKVPSVGKVLGSFEGNASYSTPKKLCVGLTGDKPAVKVGDLLVVYETKQALSETHSGFSGTLVRNLAVLKVVEVDRKRCWVETKKTFSPFVDGDKVKLYEDELQRWTRSQAKKALPDHSVKCFVVGAMPGVDHYNQLDPVVLTAGSRKGVVEGQKFQLRAIEKTGLFDQPVTRFSGTAQVFYVGPDYSMARILFNNAPIQNSFEAVYQP